MQLKHAHAIPYHTILYHIVPAQPSLITVANVWLTCPTCLSLQAQRRAAEEERLRREAEAEEQLRLEAEEEAERERQEHEAAERRRKRAEEEEAAWLRHDEEQKAAAAAASAAQIAGESHKLQCMSMQLM